MIFDEKYPLVADLTEFVLVLFPASGDGRVAGQKSVAIALANVFAVRQPTERTRLLINISRTPRDGGNALPAGKNAPHLLIEQGDHGQPGALPKQAVYVANPDPARGAFLSIEVPLSLRP